jgi:hypothetical protein
VIVHVISGIISWIRWRHVTPEIRTISAFKVTTYGISSIAQREEFENAGFVSRMEADTHADTTVAGKNCIALNFTDRSCNVQPYSDAYESLKNVPVVTAATGYTSASGLNYILIFPEALHMPQMDHSLFNPNQLRHFGTMVQDNPYAGTLMTITTGDNQFTACLETEGIDIYLNTWVPSDADLRAYPHVQLASADTWHPNSVKLPRLSNIEREEIESKNICGVQTLDEARIERQLGHELMRDTIYNVNGMQEAIISSARTTHTDMEFKISRVRFKDALPPISTPGPLEEREIKAPYTFLSSERHSNTTPEDLSERWGLSIAQAAMTLKATTRHLLRSALMPWLDDTEPTECFKQTGYRGPGQPILWT